MKCLIIDDDPVICDMLSHYLEKIEEVEFSLKAHNGIDALNLLNHQQFDFILLDLELPELSGPELLKSIETKLPVILITSSEDFALQSYEYNVVDYLLKPIEFTRFYRAVIKVKNLLQTQKPLHSADEKKNEVFVKDGHNLVKVNLDEVLYLEAESNYISIKTPSRSLLTLVSMKKMEESLPEHFIRTHRSYIVNLHKIDKIENNAIIIGKTIIPVSSSYKETLMKRLNLLI